MIVLILISIKSCTLLFYRTTILDNLDYVIVLSPNNYDTFDYMIFFIPNKKKFINSIFFQPNNQKDIYVFTEDSEVKLKSILLEHKLHYKTIIAKVDGKYYLKYRIKSNFKIDSREYLDVFVSEEKIEFMSAYRFTK